MEQRAFVVEQETAGQRIDRFLSGEDTGMSRSALQALVADGHVQCNGKTVAKSLKLKAGDTVLLEIPDAKPIEAVPQEIPLDIVYEDAHLLVVNKHSGDLVQPDPSGESALEDQIKAFIKRRDAKPGEVFLGVVHRIDRPVSGAVLFAKTSKALTRLNEMLREGRIRKVYWALTEATPDPEQGELRHYILRDGKTNRSRAYDAPKDDAKEARLRYETLGGGTHYTLLGIELLTGRHHQIRAQLSKIGCPIRGDLKYGAKRSLPGGGISLHSRCVEFDHPVRHEPVSVTAPVPAGDNLWAYFENR